jgi:hypothetical protein
MRCACVAPPLRLERAGRRETLMSIDELLAQDRAQNHRAVTECENYVRWLRKDLETEDLLAVITNVRNLEDKCAEIRAFAKRHIGSEAWHIADTAERLQEAAVTIRRLVYIHFYRRDNLVMEVALEEARQAAILVADLRERMFGAAHASGEVGSPEGS